MSDKFTFTELQEGEFFDPLSFSDSAPFTQSNEFRLWQQGLGREVKRFLIKRVPENNVINGGQNGEILGFFQTIKYELPFGKSFIYSPYGPIIREVSPESLSNTLSILIPELKKYLLNFYKKSSTVFIRLDFSLLSNKEHAAKKDSVENNEIFLKNFKNPPKSTYHSAYLQPRAEWYLDITPEENELLKNMHEKTRYLINLSARKGIQTEIIEKDFKNYFENFYSLLEETAKRNGFSLHPKKYYENIFEKIENGDNKSNVAFISVAKYENKILVMNLVVQYGDTAHFIFGGSSSEHRNISPSHAAHWAAILHAKKNGSKNYNFGGITDDCGETKDEKKTNDHLASLTSFKKKFGGYAVLHNHCYDLITKRSWYYLYISRKILKSFLTHM